MNDIGGTLPFGNEQANHRTSEADALADLQRGRRPISDIWFKTRRRRSITTASLRVGQLSLTAISASPLHFETKPDPQLSITVPVSGTGTIIEGARSMMWTGSSQILISSFSRPMICYYDAFTTLTIRPHIHNLISLVKAKLPAVADVEQRLLTLPTTISPSSSKNNNFGASVGRLLALANGCAGDAAFLRRIGFEEVTTNLVVELLASQIEAPREGAFCHEGDATTSAVDIVCNAIIEDMGAPRTTRQMAAIAGCSYRALAQAFQSRFACSPQEWQRNLFLDEARRRLKDNDNSASPESVSFMLGFSSARSFTTHYRRRFGEAPQHTSLRWKHNG